MNFSIRNHAIDTITIHCMGGYMTAAQCSNYLDNTDDSSANYCVGYDGSVYVNVPEKYRSWCSSNRENDMRAVTIEVSNIKNPSKLWEVPEAAIDALIPLLVGICQRNSIPEMKFLNDKSLIGQIDKQNVTLHRWFANKACPGDYLIGRLPEICRRVNAELAGPEVSELVKNCIINGYPDGSIRPNDAITRKQAAMLISRNNAWLLEKYGIKTI